MSFDSNLTADVSDELFWDPKLDSTAIAVSADDGKITLRGTVGSLREKREAQKAAQRVFGVISVDNKLQVKLMNDDKRADAELRGDVLQALMLDSLVPKTVDAKVEDGFVTLSGTANWQYQRDEADFVASNIVGTLDVVDEIELEYPTPDRGDVKESIKKAFKRNAALDAGDLRISTDNGTVTLKGTVSSWGEPSNTQRPVLRITAWSATSSASLRFCSTRTMDCPSSLRRRIVRSTSATISGARPSEGSSSSSTRGLPISARPIASICSSPPESVPAICA